MTRWGVLVLLLGLVAPRAYAEKAQLPPGLPPLGAMKPPAAPEIVEEKLANGMTVWLVPRAGVPKVSLTIQIRAGRGQDPRGQVGLSDLMASTMTKGTRTRSAVKIAEEMAAAGGDLVTGVDADGLSLATDVLASGVPAALEIMAEVLTAATFPEDEVAIARRQEREALQQNEAQPSFLADRAARRIYFGAHPFAAGAPTDEGLKRTTAANLRSSFRARVRPDETLLVVVGAFETEAVRTRIRALFESWRNPAGKPRTAPTVKPGGARAVYVVPRAGAVQTNLRLFLPAVTRGSADFYALQIGTTLLGGGFTSRLTQNLREDKGYTYSPGASIERWGLAGLTVARAEVRNEVTAASLNELFYELGRLATTEPTEDELGATRRYLLGALAFAFASRGAIASQLVSLWQQGLPPSELGTRAARLEKVTAAEVAAAGRAYWAPAKVRIVAVGDEKAIREAVVPLGLTVERAP